jgi:hypothetical protein
LPSGPKCDKASLKPSPREGRHEVSAEVSTHTTQPSPAGSGRAHAPGRQIRGWRDRRHAESAAAANRRRQQLERATGLRLATSIRAAGRRLANPSRLRARVLRRGRSAPQAHLADSQSTPDRQVCAQSPRSPRPFPNKHPRGGRAPLGP